MNGQATNRIAISPPAKYSSISTGTAALLNRLSKAGLMLADRGYDADGSRGALRDKRIIACIPRVEKSSGYDNRRYQHHDRIEIMFGRLKD